MSSALLTTSASLSCPHGGTVAIISGNTRASAGGAPLALASDTFTISACPFQIPVGAGSVPHPCVRVQWVVPNLACKVGGTPTLSSSSTGLCLAADSIPQGPVTVNSTQSQCNGS